MLPPQSFTENIVSKSEDSNINSLFSSHEPVSNFDVIRLIRKEEGIFNHRVHSEMRLNEFVGKVGILLFSF